MEKIEINFLEDKTFEEGKRILEEAGYVIDGSAVDTQAPGCDYIEDTYFVLYDEEDEEEDRIAFSRWMMRREGTENDDRTGDAVVKEKWGRI